MKKTFSFITVCLLAIGTLCACNKQTPDNIENDIPKKPFEPIALTKAEREISDASNQFGFDVYHKIYKGDNMLISPLSLSLALSMATNGAEGKTAEEMLSTLGFAGQDKDALNSYYQKMISALLDADPETTFEVANSIWANESIGIKQSFTDVTKEYYSSEVYPADFKTQATVDKINQWCSDKTHGKIPTILDGPDPNLVMALINALYFKAPWAEEFDEKSTRPDIFHAASGDKEVPFMHKTSRENKYLSAQGWQIASLPYKNGRYAMLVALPPKDLDVKSVAGFMNADLLNVILDNLSYNRVALSLPKFKVETTLTMNQLLSAMGAEQIFTNGADFSRMSATPLAVDKILQKCFVEVSEEGTEAAAVTGAFMRLTSVAREDPPVVMNVDRPFFFAIYDVQTRLVLFEGRIATI